MRPYLLIVEDRSELVNIRKWIDLDTVCQIDEPQLDHAEHYVHLTWQHMFKDKSENIALYQPYEREQYGCKNEKNADGVPTSLAKMQEVFKAFFEAWAGRPFEAVEPEKEEIAGYQGRRRDFGAFDDSDWGSWRQIEGCDLERWRTRIEECPDQYEMRAVTPIKEKK